MSTVQKTLHDFVPNRITPQDTLQGTEQGWRRWVAMGKQPTTLPRWTIILTYGALIATVLAGAIAFGHAASRTEDALAATKAVPELKASFDTLNVKLDQISKAQSDSVTQQNQRLTKMETEMTELVKLNSNVNALAAQVNAIQGQMGSVWALAQSDSNKVSELKGMVQAMQNMQLQQQKGK